MIDKLLLINNLNLFFMLNKADKMIENPCIYSSKEMRDIAQELECLANGLICEGEEFQEISAVANDLIDKCLSRAVVLCSFE